MYRLALAFLWLIALAPAVRAQEVVYLVRHAERVDQSADTPPFNLFVVVPHRGAAPTFLRIKY